MLLATSLILWSLCVAHRRAEHETSAAGQLIQRQSVVQQEVAVVAVSVTLPLLYAAVCSLWCSRALVRPLHAGPLVTTAPRHRHPTFSIAPALLAALLLCLASLTIAARCYASTGIQQHQQQTPQLVPTTQQQHHSLTETSRSSAKQAPASSSNLVLSRFIRSLCYNVKSDTSLIVTNSKTLLFNPNSNTRRKNERNKRELRSRFKRKNYNRIPNINEPLTIEELEKNKLKGNYEQYNVKKRIPVNSTNSSDLEKRRIGEAVILDGAGASEHLLVRYKSESLVDSAVEKRSDVVANVSAYNTSIGTIEVNGSRVSERLRIDQEIVKAAGRKDNKLSTQRPMPSAHDHPTHTCK